MNSELYDLIDRTQKAGEMGWTYLVDPVAGTVSHHGTAITEHDGCLYFAEDEGIMWPECDYQRSFEPNQFFDPANWEWHLEDYVADGIPFLIQTCVIEDITDTEDVDRMNDPDLIGWALMVKVVK